MPDLSSELKEKIISPVVLTQEVFDEICRDVCPHCRKGNTLTYRPETREHVHTTHDRKTGQFSTVICWANGFRKSRFAEFVKNG